MINLLLSPQGRISGTQFFSFIAIAMLIMVVIGFALGTVPAINGPIVLSVCWALLAWPVICTLIRRLHDTGRAAAWLWLLAPQAGMAVISLATGGYMPVFLLWTMTLLGVIANVLCWGLIFFLALKPGEVGENAYGPDPHISPPPTA